MFSFAKLRSRAAGVALAPLFLLPTVSFVLRIVGLDRRLRTQGMLAGMQWILSRYYRGVTCVSGAVPPAGPALLVGNHPGLGDLPALAVASGREDVYVVAKRRNLMADMRGVLSRCILIDDSLSSRAGAVRVVIEKIESGGVVVIFPAGEIETDSMLLDAGADFLSWWPPVVDGIVRRLRRQGLAAPIIPVYTEGVIGVPALYMRLLPAAAEAPVRQGRAALVTMMTRLARTRTVRVAFGAPVAIPEDYDGDRGSTILTRLVRESLSELRTALSGHGARSQSADDAALEDDRQDDDRYERDNRRRRNPTPLQLEGLAVAENSHRHRA